MTLSVTAARAVAFQNAMRCDGLVHALSEWGAERNAARGRRVRDGGAIETDFASLPYDGSVVNNPRLTIDVIKEAIAGQPSGGRPEEVGNESVNALDRFSRCRPDGTSTVT